MKLHDKKILLTGASGGIGKVLARALLDSGANLVLAGRNTAALNKMAQGFPAGAASVSVVQLDLGSADVFQQARLIAEQFQDIDVLLNCAGVNLFAASEHAAPEAVASVLDINLKGTILLTQALLPVLQRRPKALIVNVGSTFGSIGYPGFAAYCASKFGLRGYTEALRRELGGSGINVIYVAPRATVTEMNVPAVQIMNEALGNVMDPPEKVAACVVNAIQRERRRTFIGWPEKFFVVLNSLLTGVVDAALIRQLPVIQRFLLKGVKP